MKKRCCQCKCLEEESPKKYAERIKYDLKSKFYCRACCKANPELKPIKKSRQINETKQEIKRFEDVCRIEIEKLDQERKRKFREFNQTEPTIKGRRRYSNTDKGKVSESIRNYNARIRRMKTADPCYGLSMEEKIAIGRFYRKRPEGYEVDHIIPLKKGGRHEISNLQYLTKDENKRKAAKEWTKKIKTEIFEAVPFTPIPEQVDEIKISSEKRNRTSKFKRMRTLVKNNG